MKWEIKDLENEIYAMKMAPCGDRECKVSFKHKCGWKDKDEEDAKFALHLEKVKVRQLIAHINSYYADFERRAMNNFPHRNIASASGEDGRINFIWDYSSFFENSNFFGVRVIPYFWSSRLNQT